MAQKMLSSFINISAGILLLILGFSSFTERHIFPHFCQMMLQLKALKIIFVKAALIWHQKCW
jgi:hypothetical protein